jgi:hypothetical protein
MEVRFHIQVVSDVILFEEVPTCVTRVSDNVISLVFHECILPDV